MAGGNTIGSVYVRVRPRVKNFRRETEDELRRDLTKPIEVDVKTQLNEEGLKDMERELDKQLKPIQRKATIKFDADYDGISRAMDRVKRQLKDIQRQEIEFKANTDGLNDALDELERRQKDSVAKIDFSADEASYNAILQKIEDIRRQNRTIELEFKTDEESLRAMENTARRKLEEMKRWEPIEFRYTDDVEGNRRLKERIEALKKERVEIPVNLNVDDNTLDAMLAEATSRSRDVDITPSVNMAAAMWAEGTLAALARDRWVDLKPRINGRIMRDLQGAFLAIAGVNTVGKLVEQIERVALNFDEVTVAASTMGAAIGSAISLGTVAMGSLLSIAGDTLQVFQGLAMAPTLMLSGASILQTWKAVWNDFGAALMGIEEAFEALPPNAQAGVRAIERLNAEVNQVVQDNFWGEMTDEVQRFTDTIGPHVVKTMGEVASVMGDSISRMINHAEKLAKSGQLEHFTRNNTRFMQELGDAATIAFEALMHMGIQGSRYLPRLGKWVKSLSEDFKSFIDEAVRTGKFDVWIQNSIRSIQSLGQFAKGTWDMLAGLTRAFESVGGKGLHEMADGMERVADFVNSTGFQRKMEGIFRAAMDGSVHVGRGFADLMAQLYSMDQFLGTLLRKTGQLTGEFITQVSRALDSAPLQQGLVDMFDGMIDFVSKAGPGFESIANIWGRLSSIGGEVAREIAHGMNLTMGAIDGFIARIQGPLINAIHPLTKVFEDIAALGTPVLFGLANTLGTVLNLFTLLPGPIQNVVTMLMLLGRTGVLAGFLTAIQSVGGHFATMRAKAAREVVMLERSTGASFGRMAAVVAGHTQMMATAVQARMNVIGQTFRNVFGMRGLMGVLGGPWGIAITAAIGSLAAFAGASAEAKAKQDELKSTLDQVTGAMTEQSSATLFDQMTADLSWVDKTAQYLSRWMHNFKGSFTGEFVDTLSGSFAEMATSIGLGMDQVVEIMSQGGSAAQDFAGDLMHLYQLAQQGWSTDALREEAERIGYVGDVAEITAGKMAMAGPMATYLWETYGTLANESDRLREKQELLGTAMTTASDLWAELPDRITGIAAAMDDFNSAATSAEEKAQAFRRALDLMSGDDGTAREIEKNAFNAIDSAMAKLDELAEREGFDWGSYFDPKTGELDFSNSVAREIDTELRTLNDGLVDRIAATKQAFAENRITKADAEAQFEEIIKEARNVPQVIGEMFGLSSEQIKQLQGVWDGLRFDEKDATVLFSAMGETEVQDRLDEIMELGNELSAAEFIATFDADGDGAITEAEMANGVGMMWADQIFQAQFSGDVTETQNAIAEGANLGSIWDGEQFVATIGADGNPTAEAIAAAKLYGIEWDGQRWIATMDAEEDPAMQERIMTAITTLQGFAVDHVGRLILEGSGVVQQDVTLAEQATARWDGGRFIGTLVAEGAEGVISRSNAAKEAADGVTGPRSATLSETGSGAVTSNSNVASRAADNVDGTRTAVHQERGGALVANIASIASTRADEVDGVRQAVLRARDYASDVISNAVGWLAQFKDKTISIVTNLFTNRREDNADGSLTDSKFKPRVRTFANGGFENHVAQIASPATPFRVWAEPETGGEAYIPMSASKRGRSLAIWQEVGRRFGVYADGGVTGSGATPTKTTEINVVNHYPKAEPTSRTVNDGLEYAAALGFN